MHRAIVDMLETMSRNKVQKLNIRSGRPMNLGLDPLRPCSNHSWMIEQQSGHKWCHVCGIHAVDSKGRC